MDLYEQATKLNKEIEKLTTSLTDGTALTQGQQIAKENKSAQLIAQLTTLNQQLPPVVVTKIIHKD